MSTASTLSAVTLPDPALQQRYEALCGLDDVKAELSAALKVALSPSEFSKWAKNQKGFERVTSLVASRPQLFILGGDVGSGKTELAQTIGDPVARESRLTITLFSLSLAARGTGFVGEMTQRIVDAFDEVRQWGDKRKTAARAGGILFIDEADAIAQSRSLAQMHHEDRAGVNALIRGIDDLAKARIPVAVIMATNRLNALDPAIRRRAAMEFVFARPNQVQREAVYRSFFPSWPPAEIAHVASVSHGTVGFSYSDIVQRIIPRAVLTAFRAGSPIIPSDVLFAAQQTNPTPPFGDEA